MITKISCMAYSSNTNNIQKQNQPQNINFGTLPDNVSQSLKNLGYDIFGIGEDPNYWASKMRSNRIFQQLRNIFEEAPNATGKELGEAFKEVLRRHNVKLPNGLPSD